ncbi:MAG: type IV pilus twitching motility protein PilT, partial [Planctomycetota bacterium]
MSTENNTDSQPKLYKYFRAAIKINASDLHIKTGQPPRLRVFGQLKDTTGGALSSEKIKELVFEILSEEQQEHFLRNGTLDFAYELGNDDRFRINIYRQRGFISLAARRVSVDVPSLEQLHLPAVIEKIAKENQGLILVTGPTGCGKTTSIAAIIDHINSTRSCHIVTIEDPIEYLFKDKKSFVSQREIGIDVEDFELALKYLMRQ